jgi:hypothetical protein
LSIENETPETGDKIDVAEVNSRVHENLEALLWSIQDLSRELVLQREILRAGIVDSDSLGFKLNTDLTKIISQTIAQENRLNDLISDRAGHAAEYAIDFERARSEIGSRLARLRGARDTSAVSGEPE